MPERLRPSEILADPTKNTCSCPEKDCDWHGKCMDCVALHRYYITIPNCLSASAEKPNASDSDNI